MSFDPNKPVDGALVSAAELRGQFNALHSLIGGAAGVPVGSVVAWLKNLSGVPTLPDGWIECNGQVVNDPASPLHGVTLPDLNGGAGRFLRGAAASGTLGGIDYFGTASADNAGIGATFAAVTTDFSPGAEPFPPYCTVVWVVKVK
jgi:hypothetical protein